ncbi:hypothetical protein Trydic_g18357 [Trypoxylus dichotomus]
MYLFKIWSANRREKFFILAKVNRDIYNDVLVQATVKFRRPIERIALEKDGTVIDDEEILIMLKDETLIALSSGERWLSVEESAASTAAVTTPAFCAPNPPTTSSNVPVISSTVSSNRPTSPSPPAHISTSGTLPVLEPTTISISELSELAMKKDIYDMNFETTMIKCDQTSDNSDVENANSIISYVSDDSNSRQEDVNETNSMCHERNMEIVWNEFQIPWEKIPNYMVKTCERGKKNKQIVTEIIHIIVNEMRQIKTNIPSKAFKLIALKLAARFPYVFRDFDEDGVVIGDGTHSITMKLLDRNNYLNRPPKRSLNAIESRKYRRTVQNARIGCSNWEPNQSSSSRRSQMTLTSAIPFSDDFYNLLSETYADQRRFFNNVNNPPSIAEIKEKWPAILTTAGIFWHFGKLTSIDLNDVMRNISEKSMRLLQFGIQRKLIDNTEIDEDKELASLEIISRYFKEDLKTVFRLHKNVEKSNIPTENLLQSPSVIKFENLQESGYLVYLEQTPINDNVYPTFLEAFVISFALYFITNLQYAKEICYTMEMVQRYYCKIHPDVGSKSGKKAGAKSRVLTLINKLHHVV